MEFTPPQQQPRQSNPNEVVYVPSDFEANWPQTDELAAQQQHFQEGLALLGDVMVLPDDKRMQVGVGLSSLGGQHATVAYIGTSGSGKTTINNMVYGSANRIEITSTHTAEKLLGYPNPINPDQYVPGDINPKDPADAAIYLNELPHIRNTGPMHPVLDGGFLRIGNRVLNLDDASIGITGNFADGNRSHEFDDALLSRLSAVVLCGDGGEKFSKKLRSIDLADIYAREKQADIEKQKRRAQGLPEIMPVRLLPPQAIRRLLRQEIAIISPYDRSATAENAAEFKQKTLKSMAQSRLFKLLDPKLEFTDVRSDHGWSTTARVMRLVNGVAHKPHNLTATELKQSATLGLGPLAYLSHEGIEFFEKVWDGDRLSPMQAAIGARWAIAAIAAKEHNPDITEKDLHAHLLSYSFATIPDSDTSNQTSNALYKRIVREERESNDDRSRAAIPRRRA